MSTWKSSLNNSAWILFACINALLSFSVLGNSLQAYRTYTETGVVSYPPGFWLLILSVFVLAGLTAYFVMKTEKEVSRVGMIILASLGPIGIAAFSLYRLYDHVGSL